MLKSSTKITEAENKKNDKSVAIKIFTEKEYHQNKDATSEEQQQMENHFTG